MPFIGQDWRSPGEAWVKTETLGWQRLKLIESHIHPVCGQSSNCSWPPRSSFGQHMAQNCGNLAGNHHDNHICTNPLVQPVAESRDDVSSPESSSFSDSCFSNFRGGSTSPTPSVSPDKCYTQHQRSFPIMISSPYGQYSYCGHQLDYDSYKLKANFESPKAQSPNLAHMQSHKNNAQKNKSSSLESGSSSSSSSLSTTKQPGNNIDNIMNKFALLQQNNNNNKNKDSWNQHRRDSATKLKQNSQPTTTTSPNDDDSKKVYTSPVGCFVIDDVTHNGQDQGRNANKGFSAPSNNKTDSTNRVVHHHHHHHTCGHDQVQCHNSRAETSSPGSPSRNLPHCRISVRTREVAMYNTISEAFYRLDFCNAVHDIRRFNYICKLLHLLITQNLTSLSGCATKALFTMLEQVACEVASNKRNIHVLKNLLNELRLMIKKYHCWGRPIGSSQLWQQHFETIERISQMVDEIDIAPKREQKSEVTFNQLPVEMIREILFRFNDYHDLLNSAKVSPVMNSMINDQEIWRRLCKYHFTEEQVKMVLDWHRDGQPANKFAKTSRSHHSKQRKTTNKDDLNMAAAGRHRLQGSAKITPTTSTSTNDQGNSSYVTRTIRIFDQKKSLSRSTSLGDENESPNEATRKQLRHNNNNNRQVQKSASASCQVQAPTGSDTVKQHHNHQTKSSKPFVDWEQIFHQLRKKFDLKEEYADCLLLCRHCRCLFWKSFGHPCIKDDEQDGATGSQQATRKCHGNSDSSAPRASHLPGGVDGQDVCYCDRISQQRRQIIGNQIKPEADSGSGNSQNRLSVAVLSRNFDVGNNINNTNQSGNNNNQNHRFDSSTNSINRRRQPSDARLSSEQSRPGVQHLRENIGARLAGNYENNGVLRRPPYEPHVSNNRVPRNLQHNYLHHQHQANQQQQAKPKELVPKHVTISPQAFLKFFSL